MKKTEDAFRQQMAMHGQSLFDRGYTCGGSGNMSVKIDDGILLTPTNSCLGRLDPASISKLDWEGNHLSGHKPSKEGFLHLAMYQSRPQDRAVVHLHSPYAVAVSCLDGLDPTDALPPVTPYFVMRIGRLPLVSYFPPGDQGLAKAVGHLAAEHNAILMARHGTVAAGKDLEAAVYAAEELEETAKLFMLLKNSTYQVLNEEEVAALRDRSST